MMEMLAGSPEEAPHTEAEEPEAKNTIAVPETTKFDGFGSCECGTWVLSLQDVRLQPNRSRTVAIYECAVCGNPVHIYNGGSR